MTQAILRQASASFAAVTGGQDLQQQHLMASQHHEFTFQLELRQKLQSCLCSLAQQIPLRNIGCIQVWKTVGQQQPGCDPLTMQLYADPELGVLGDPCFTSFRMNSCQSLQWGKEGMPGRVLKSGCVQVVQNLRIIPDVLHPRCRIPDAITDQVGEVVYVPVYCVSRPHVGPMAVLEAVLSAHATDSMLVANFISIAGTALSAVQLSLSNPLPQPVRRSNLEGRKPRPVHTCSSQESLEYRPAVAATAPCCGGTAPGHQLQATPTQVPAALQSSCTGAAGGVCCEMAAADITVQPSSCSCAVPGSPITSDDRQLGHGSSCSAASTSMVIGGLGAGAAEPSVGTAVPSTADSLLDSTLNRRCNTRLMMPPHQSRHIGSRRQRRSLDCQVQRDAAVSGAPDEFERPRKLQRTLSMSRTKSVPVGLDQVLDAAIATQI